MTASLAHRITNEGVTILLRSGGDTAARILVTYEEAKRFGWSLLADVDPDGAEEAGGARDDQIDRLRRAFRLTPAVAHTLIVLARADKPVNRYDLSDAIGTKSHGKVIDVYISRLRKKLGWPAIETMRGAGFSLSDEARGRVAQALGLQAAA